MFFNSFSIIWKPSQTFYAVAATVALCVELFIDLKPRICEVWPHGLLWMSWFDEKSISNAHKYLPSLLTCVRWWSVGCFASPVITGWCRTKPLGCQWPFNAVKNFSKAFSKFWTHDVIQNRINGWIDIKHHSWKMYQE